MSVMGLFFVLIAATAGVWLARQGVMQSPWLEEGEFPKYSERSTLSPPPASKVGLGVFLAVAGCLFSLLTAAFFMRMDAPDWQSPPASSILWINTFVLVLSDFGLLSAQFAAAQGQIPQVRISLLVSGAAALFFLLGQFWIWRELVGLGFYASSNPAYAFFYLLTGIHALHLLGGVVALGRTSLTAWKAHSCDLVSTSVELCAIYWHFLLLVWLLLFAMLTGGANSFGVICRRLLS
jgi:cytochrome c oxidase subunit 3